MTNESEKETTEAPAQSEQSGQAEVARAAPAAAEEERPRRPRGRFGRRRACVMCVEKRKGGDYKAASFLRRFLSDRGRIEPRRKSSCCAKHQRALARAIK